MKHTKFVGQLLSPAVEADVVALLGDRCPDVGEWPPGTVVSADGGTVTYTGKYGRGTTCAAPGRFAPERREREWFVRVTADGRVTATDEVTDETVDGGVLPRPLVSFVSDWKIADMLVMGEMYAMSMWYRDDLAAWHLAEAARLNGE